MPPPIKMAQARAQWNDAMKQGKSPGRMHLILLYAVAQLPVHPQYNGEVKRAIHEPVDVTTAASGERWQERLLLMIQFLAIRSDLNFRLPFPDLNLGLIATILPCSINNSIFVILPFPACARRLPSTLPGRASGWTSSSTSGRLPCGSIARSFV